MNNSKSVNLYFQINFSWSKIQEILTRIYIPSLLFYMLILNWLYLNRNLHILYDYKGYIKFISIFIYNFQNLNIINKEFVIFDNMISWKIKSNGRNILIIESESFRSTETPWAKVSEERHSNQSVWTLRIIDFPTST